METSSLRSLWTRLGTGSRNQVLLLDVLPELELKSGPGARYPTVPSLGSQRGEAEAGWELNAVALGFWRSEAGPVGEATNL